MPEPRQSGRYLAPDEGAAGSKHWPETAQTHDALAASLQRGHRHVECPCGASRLSPELGEPLPCGCAPSGARSCRTSPPACALTVASPSGGWPGTRPPPQRWSRSHGGRYRLARNRPGSGPRPGPHGPAPRPGLVRFPGPPLVRGSGPADHFRNQARGRPVPPRCLAWLRASWNPGASGPDGPRTSRRGPLLARGSVRLLLRYG